MTDFERDMITSISSAARLAIWFTKYEEFIEVSRLLNYDDKENMKKILNQWEGDNNGKEN